MKFQKKSRKILQKLEMRKGRERIEKFSELFRTGAVAAEELMYWITHGGDSNDHWKKLNKD